MCLLPESALTCCQVDVSVKLSSSFAGICSCCLNFLDLGIATAAALTPRLTGAMQFLAVALMVSLLGARQRLLLQRRGSLDSATTSRSSATPSYAIHGNVDSALAAYLQMQREQQGLELPVDATRKVTSPPPGDQDRTFCGVCAG